MPSTLGLRACDPAAADQIHPNNLVRVIRALEVYELTGTPMSELQQQWHPEKQRYRFSGFCLAMPRPQLYLRIEQRVDVMLANGLLPEVESLLAAGYARDTLALPKFRLQRADSVSGWGMYLYGSNHAAKAEHPPLCETATHMVPQRYPP